MKAAFGVGFLFQNKVNTLFAGWAYLCDAVIGVNAYRRTYERMDGRTDRCALVRKPKPSFLSMRSYQHKEFFGNKTHNGKRGNCSTNSSLIILLFCLNRQVQ